jgi:chromosome segregation ATPase
VNKGYLDIITELMSKIQVDPYTHLGGRMQVLENHRKALEEKINIYKDDAKDLEKRLMTKDRELDHQLENGRKIKEEKDLLESKLKELRKKVMFTKECLRFENDAELLKVCSTGKAFSTRSYHTPPQIKKLKEIAVRKDFNLAV